MLLPMRPEPEVVLIVQAVEATGRLLEHPTWVHYQMKWVDAIEQCDLTASVRHVADSMRETLREHGIRLPVRFGRE